MLLTLLACNDPVSLDQDDLEVEPIDVSIPLEDLGPLTADQLVLTGPELVLDPATDTMTCLYGTYTGPDVGLHDVKTFQGEFGHHFQLLGTSTPAIDAPDGTIIDCSGDSGDYTMAALEPIGLPNHVLENGRETISMPLPDGMAVSLESGQRYILQSHYLNTGSAPIKISDKAVLSTVPLDEVVTWTAPMVFNDSDFRIPPGETGSATFSCTTETDLNLLYTLGHMHEWGTSFRVDQVDEDVRTPFYAVETWDPVYRDAPFIVSHVDAPLLVPGGTTFETTCTWANDTDEDLVFPHEMCVSISFVYPQKTTIICSP